MTEDDIKKLIMNSPHFRCGKVEEECEGCEYEAGVLAHTIAKMIRDEEKIKEEGLNRKTYGIGECDFCPDTTILVQGPYDNLICMECVEKFSKGEIE